MTNLKKWLKNNLSVPFNPFNPFNPLTVPFNPIGCLTLLS